jgi:hypothetical protein
MMYIIIIIIIIIISSSSSSYSIGTSVVWVPILYVSRVYTYENSK